jgi:hypothetical protein
MSLKISNLSSIADPILQAALKSIEDAHNRLSAIVGVSSSGPAKVPQNAGNIAVVQTAGIYDVTISDPANQRGEVYFLEYDTQASFATAHLISLGPSRHWRGTLGNLGNTWWRMYKQLAGSDASPWITFSGNPVAGGGTTGPTLGTPKGSGSSNQSGRGLGPIGS